MHIQALSSGYADYLLALTAAQSAGVTLRQADDHIGDKPIVAMSDSPLFRRHGSHWRLSGLPCSKLVDGGWFAIRPEPP